MALNIKARITLDGILSFINTELKGGHDDVVIEFLENKLNYVTQMKEKFNMSETALLQRHLFKLSLFTHFF